jgi:hypothetical protein
MAGSRPDETSDAAWRGFVVRFVAVFFAALAVVLAFIVLVDPYDVGRFPTLGISGISDDNQRTENVSLGRSKKFNAAIFGNSHGQLLDPERLSQATGLSFVQLAIPGANAPEQIAMIHWFVRHHARIGALVIAADERWCGTDPQPWKWFPFWLYGDSDVQYLVNSLNSRSAGAGIRRIKNAFGLVNASNPRGYDDYEIGIAKDYRFDFPLPSAKPAPTASEIAAVELGNRPFPAIDRLAAEIAAAPADTPLVILFPPQYYATLPDEAYAAAVLKECKARFARLATGAPRRGFLDFFVDSPITRDSDNFNDIEHYRAPVARRIEQEIAGVLTGRPVAARSR